jgi:hypothetical protein
MLQQQTATTKLLNGRSQPMPFTQPIRQAPTVVRGNDPVPLWRAQQIMQRNFVSLFETDTTAGGFRTNLIFLEQIMTPKGRLISEAELIASRKTHVLILVPQGSIMQLRESVARLYVTPFFKPQSWYEQEDFAHEPGRAGWHLIRKNLFGVDIHPRWDVQRSLLPEDEETPTTRTMTYTMVRFYLATGERLASDAFARCSSRDSDKHRGKVGYFGREGLSFAEGLAEGSSLEPTCSGRIGLAAAKKQL